MAHFDEGGIQCVIWSWLLQWRAADPSVVEVESTIYFEIYLKATGGQLQVRVKKDLISELLSARS
jgi:hypothetical protein